MQQVGPDLIELVVTRHNLTLVPVVNESAFLAGSRAGKDQLDLARVCPGQVDGQATEKLAYHLSALIRSVDFYVDLHTGGTELSVLPLAGYILHSDPDVLSQQRRMALAFNLPFVWGTSANLEGRSLSVARDARVPAIYCEYLGSAVCDPAGVEAYVNGCLNVMNELSMLDRQPPANQVTYIVEDDQPGSGHMQVCHPSPTSGLFEARVCLGDHVQQGQTIGIVHEHDSTARQPVHADKSGMMIVLRSFPRVRKGDSVGVVVNTRNPNGQQRPR